MIVWMTTFVLLIAGHFLVCGQKKPYIIFATVLLILVSGLRSFSVGADTLAYKALFEQGKQYGTHILASRDIEIGFLWFQMIMGKIFPHYQVYLFVFAILTMSCFGYFVKCYSSLPVWSYLLYYALFFPFYSMTGMRQTLAANCVCWRSP